MKSADEQNFARVEAERVKRGLYSAENIQEAGMSNLAVFLADRIKGDGYDGLKGAFNTYGIQTEGAGFEKSLRFKSQSGETYHFVANITPEIFKEWTDTDKSIVEIMEERYPAFDGFVKSIKGSLDEKRLQDEMLNSLESGQIDAPEDIVERVQDCVKDFREGEKSVAVSSEQIDRLEQAVIQAEQLSGAVNVLSEQPNVFKDYVKELTSTDSKLNVGRDDVLKQLGIENEAADIQSEKLAGIIIASYNAKHPVRTAFNAAKDATKTYFAALKDIPGMLRENAAVAEALRKDALTALSDVEKASNLKDAAKTMVLNSKMITAERVCSFFKDCADKISGKVSEAVAFGKTCISNITLAHDVFLDSVTLGFHSRVMEALDKKKDNCEKYGVTIDDPVHDPILLAGVPFAGIHGLCAGYESSESKEYWDKINRLSFGDQKNLADTIADFDREYSQKLVDTVKNAGSEIKKAGERALTGFGAGLSAVCNTISKVPVKFKGAIKAIGKAKDKALDALTKASIKTAELSNYVAKVVVHEAKDLAESVAKRENRLTERYLLKGAKSLENAAITSGKIEESDKKIDEIKSSSSYTMSPLNAVLSEVLRNTPATENTIAAAKIIEDSENNRKKWTAFKDFFARIPKVIKESVHNLSLQGKYNAEITGVQIDSAKSFVHETFGGLAEKAAGKLSSAEDKVDAVGKYLKEADEGIEL